MVTVWGSRKLPHLGILYDWFKGQRNDYEIFVKSETKESKMTVQRYFRLEAVGLAWVTKIIDWRKHLHDPEKLERRKQITASSLGPT